MCQLLPRGKEKQSWWSLVGIPRSALCGDLEEVSRSSPLGLGHESSASVLRGVSKGLEAFSQPHM